MTPDHATAGLMSGAFGARGRIVPAGRPHTSPMVGPVALGLRLRPREASPWVRIGSSTSRQDAAASAIVSAACSATASGRLSSAQPIGVSAMIGMCHR